MARLGRKKSGSTAQVKTSARLASVCYILGISILTIGLTGLICVLATVDSTVVSYIKGAFRGLSGSMCLFLPLMLIWLGSALIVHTHHGVSARNFVIASLLFLAISALITMAINVTGYGFLMQYIPTANQSHSSGNNNILLSDPTSLLSYITRVFLWGQEGKTTLAGGGALSMLIAYPVYRVFGAVGGLIFSIFLVIVLIVVLFKLDVVGLIRSLSDKIEAAKTNKNKSVSQEIPDASAQPELSQKQQNIPLRPISKTQTVVMETSIDQEQPAVPQPAAFEIQQPAVPVYTPPTPAPSAPDPFVAMDNSHTIYDEYMPRRSANEQPKETPAAQVQTPVIQPRQQPAPLNADVSPAETKNPLPEKEPEQQPIPRHSSQSAKPVQQEASSEKEDWLQKLRQKQEEIRQRHAASQDESKQSAPVQESPKAPRSYPMHTPAHSSEPKQVFTDPAVELTGERIPISPAQTRDSSPRMLDNTPISTPKHTEQTTLSLPIHYTPPSFDFLNKGKNFKEFDTSAEDEARGERIVSTLANFNVPAEVMETTHGPAITRFALKIAEGIKVSRINSLQDNIALSMGTDRVRIESPILGTSYVGIEIPNKQVMPVTLREVLESDVMQKNPSPLLVALGKDIAGNPITCELSKMPHLLIAGATGSGKSVCINSIIGSLIYRADYHKVRLIMVDPKQVELQVYNGIPHLLNPVISDPKKAAGVLNWAVTEMLERYSKFSAKSVRNLDGYNKKVGESADAMPYIVIIIDEMADLMQTCRKDVEDSISRLAALARAAGIYMVLATQRPSVDVITGVIKNNIPSRIAFTVSSGVDSRTIIDTVGAEKLMGKGDMLYLPTGATKPTRVQGCFVSDDEVTGFTDDIRSRYTADYDPNIMESMETQQAASQSPDSAEADPAPDGNEGQFQDLLMEAIRMAVEDRQTSISMLQRRLRIGYARAGRLIDEMTKRGIISESEGSKPRKTLINMEQYAELLEEEQST